MSPDQKQPPKPKPKPKSRKPVSKAKDATPAGVITEEQAMNFTKERTLRLIKSNPDSVAQSMAELLEENKKFKSDTAFLTDYIKLLYKQVIGMKLQFNIPLTPKEKEQVPKLI